MLEDNIDELIDLYDEEHDRYLALIAAEDKQQLKLYEKSLNQFYENSKEHIKSEADLANACMAWAIKAVASSETVSPHSPFTLPHLVQIVPYLWTALMMLGDILPNKQFDHDAIKLHNLSEEEFYPRKQMGWFSRFGSYSLYQTHVLPALKKTTIELFMGYSSIEVELHKQASRQKITRDYEEKRVLAVRQKQVEKAEKMRLEDEARIAREAIAKERKDANLRMTQNNALLAKIELHSSTARDIKQLIELGADINYQSEDGYSALTLATELQKSETIIRFLLEARANPFLETRNGQKASDLTPRNSPLYALLKGYELLHTVMYFDKKRAKLILSEPDIEVDFEKVDGSTALMIAVQKTHYDVAEMLIKQGANIDKPRKNGDTARKLGNGRIIGLFPPANSNYNASAAMPSRSLLYK